jgi:AcrR family transcriptional regulator
VTRAKVVERAIRIIDADGPDALTLSRLARELGIRPPSLFDHVAGLPELLRTLRIRSFEAQTELLRVAASGRSRDDALRAVAAAYREFTTAHPGLYRMSVRTFVGDAPEVQRAAGSLLAAFLEILRGYTLSDDEVVHAARFARAALHGFLMLESEGGFGLDADVAASFERTVDATCGVLGAWPPASAGHGSIPGDRGRTSRPRARRARPSRS